ncbi:MAG TPA: DUF6576 domain-containing protein [Rubricoccaceae bacterium]|jgi:hypothetical protein
MADPNSPLSRLQLWRAMLPPALRALLTANVATYVVFVVLSIVGQGGLLAWLALPGSVADLARQPWGVLTWGVTNLYGGFFGLITFAFGVSWLSMLGRDIEEEAGPHGLLGLYAFGTLGGAALALAVGAAGPLPGGFGGAVYFGVWGPLLALLCFTATLHPDRGIGLFLLGVVPLKWIAIGAVVLELAFSKDPSHLGAALAGALFAVAHRRGVDLGAWARPLFRTRTRATPAARKTAGRPSPRPSPGPRTGPTAAPPARTSRPAASDVDAVLDKILDKGVDSLTDEERRILDRAGRG